MQSQDQLIPSAVVLFISFMAFTYFIREAIDNSLTFHFLIIEWLIQK